MFRLVNDLRVILRPYLYAFAVFFSILGSCCLIFFAAFFILREPQSFISLSNFLNIETDKLDHLGSICSGVVGAIFSFSSIILVVESLERQKEDVLRQSIENRFFNLLMVYSETIEKLSINSDISGRKAFDAIVNMYFILFGKVERHLKEIYKTDPDKSTEKEEYILKKFCFEVTYNLLTFGTAELNTKRIINEHKKRFNVSFLKTADNYLSVYSQVSNLLSESLYKENKSYFFQQYFPLILQIVNYINCQPSELISFNKKLEYIDILLSKMTKEEQILLFWNALTHYGEDFEFRYKKLNFNGRPNPESNINKCLITKYNLVKNIDDSIFFSQFEIKPSDYFPDVVYYSGTTSKRKKQLMTMYK